jgi:fructan beta-fructosidase
MKIKKVFLAAILFMLSTTLMAQNDKTNVQNQEMQTFDTYDNEPRVYTYREEHRPQFHFTAPAQRINDPNGLIYYEGEWHLYYQTRPGSRLFPGGIAWGHAKSKDLLHWEHQPLPGVYDSSGNGIIDYGNKTGLGTGRKDVFLVFHGHQMSYSTDRGQNYTLSDKDLEYHGDPFAFWYQPDQKWKMVNFDWPDNPKDFFVYESDDLQNWTRISKLKGDLHECPNVFSLPVVGEDTKKWIVHDASGKYQIGKFDGRDFTAGKDHGTLSRGPNFYASQNFFNGLENDNRTVQIAWMYRGGDDYPGMPFNQQLTIPCELKLKRLPEGLRISRLPVKEIEKLRKKAVVKKKNVEIKTGIDLLDGAKGDLFDLECEIDLGSQNNPEIELNVRGTILKYSRELLQKEVKKSIVKIRVLIDRSSIEIFFDEGQYSETHTFLPKKDNMNVTLRIIGGVARANYIRLYPMKSVWPEKGVSELQPVMTDGEAKRRMNENRSKHGFYEQ